MSILRECGNEFCHVCGGTIISPAWILTSAHCVSSVPIEEMGILLGDHNLYELSYEQKFVRAAEKVTHPGRYCMQQICRCIVDVLWGQPIKLIQVVSTSKFHEY